MKRHLTQKTQFTKSDNFSLDVVYFQSNSFYQGKMIQKIVSNFASKSSCFVQNHDNFKFGIFVIDLAVLIIHNLVIFNVNSEARSQFSTLSKNGIFVIDLVVSKQSGNTFKSII